MKRRVVVVDDSKFVASQLKKFFENELDAEVVAVGFDGQEAIDLYRIHRPDLITLDVTMPVIDGSLALKEILTQFPAAKVVMITAVEGNEDNAVLFTGASGFIQKPFKVNDPEFIAATREKLGKILELP